MLCATLLLAVYFSLIFFPAVSYVIGPQGHNGDIVYWLLNPLKKLICSKKEKAKEPVKEAIKNESVNSEKKKD